MNIFSSSYCGTELKNGSFRHTLIWYSHTDRQNLQKQSGWMLTDCSENSSFTNQADQELSSQFFLLSRFQTNFFLHSTDLSNSLSLFFSWFKGPSYPRRLDPAVLNPRFTATSTYHGQEFDSWQLGSYQQCHPHWSKSKRGEQRLQAKLPLTNMVQASHLRVCLDLSFFIGILEELHSFISLTSESVWLRWAGYLAIAAVACFYMGTSPIACSVHLQVHQRASIQRAHIKFVCVRARVCACVCLQRYI